jgi:hypothetical protein
MTALAPMTTVKSPALVTCLPRDLSERVDPVADFRFTNPGSAPGMNTVIEGSVVEAQKRFPIAPHASNRCEQKIPVPAAHSLNTDLERRQAALVEVC